MVRAPFVSDGRVRPVAEGQHQHRNSGEAGMLQQLADGETKVVKHDR